VPSAARKWRKRRRPRKSSAGFTCVFSP